MDPNFSPYQPPQSGQPAGPPPVVERKPGALTTFGVLHLVGAALGALSTIFAVISMLFPELMTFAGPNNPAMEMQKQPQMAAVTLVSAGFTVILAVLLAIAGMKLLRGRRDALRWSNRYAWTSIATKLISFVMAILIVAPATRAMLEATAQASPPGSAEAEVLAMTMQFTVIGTIVSPIIGCIYPILALIILNRPRIKDWLAQQPI